MKDLEPYLGAMAHFVLFPESGRYKVWVQLQRRGEVVTVPCVLRVVDAAQAEAHAGH